MHGTLTRTWHISKVTRLQRDKVERKDQDEKQ